MRTLVIADQEVIERIRAGDRDAFEHLFRAFYPDLVRYARAELGEPAEAEDVVHDVFLRLWRNRHRVGGDRSLRSYLLRAVRNRIVDHLRHRGVERRWVRSGSMAAGGPESMWHGVPDPASFDDAASLAELDEAIRDAVARLPERCRTAFILCKQQELTYAEAADVMGVAPATVKTQIARALVALRTSLGPFLALLLALSSTCLR